MKNLHVKMHLLLVMVQYTWANIMKIFEITCKTWNFTGTTWKLHAHFEANGNEKRQFQC